MANFVSFLLIAALLVAAPGTARGETSLVRTDTGRTIEAGTLDRTLGQSGVFARLEAGESLAFLGLTLDTGADSSAMFRRSRRQ